MRTYQDFVLVSIEVEVIRLVKVRSYKRVRFGKVEKETNAPPDWSGAICIIIFVLLSRFLSPMSEHSLSCFHI